MISFEEYLKTFDNHMQKYFPSSFTPAEEAVFKVKNLYDTPEKKANEYKFKSIKFAFKHHYENNAFYRKFCKESDVSPDDIKQIKDFAKIPLIPDKFFKTYPAGKEFAMWLASIYTGELPDIVVNKNDDHDAVINKFNAAGLTISYSSGTSGKHTFIPRDRRTFFNTEYAIAKAVLTMIYPFWEYESFGYVMMPNPLKTNVFAGKVCSSYFDVVQDVQISMDRELTANLIRAAMSDSIKGRLVRRGIASARKKMVDRMIKWTRDHYAKGDKISFLGAPFILYAVMQELKQSGETFDFGERCGVATGGGWKMFENQRLSVTKFRDLAKETLGVLPEYCLDLYGMVEGNGWMVHCPEGHYLHIPNTYYHTLVLDDNGDQVAEGEKGRFAFLDGLSSSYPSFIVTGDEVRMHDHCPVCDRTTPVLEPEVKRVVGAEIRGCAEEMRRVLSMDLGGN